MNEVEILVGVSIENLSVSQLTILLQKLQLLLHNSTSDVTFTLLDILGHPMAGKLLFFINTKKFFLVFGALYILIIFRIDKKCKFCYLKVQVILFI